MSFGSGSLDNMKMEITDILKRDKRFGSLHRLESSADGELILIWDNAVLRQKTKAHPGPYLAFMEDISDCLSDYGYCLMAEEELIQQERNNYLLIVLDDDADLEE